MSKLRTEVQVTNENNVQLVRYRVLGLVRQKVVRLGWWLSSLLEAACEQEACWRTSMLGCTVPHPEWRPVLPPPPLVPPSCAQLALETEEKAAAQRANDLAASALEAEKARVKAVK